MFTKQSTICILEVRAGTEIGCCSSRKVAVCKPTPILCLLIETRVKPNTETVALCSSVLARSFGLNEDPSYAALDVCRRAHKNSRHCRAEVPARVWSSNCASLRHTQTTSALCECCAECVFSQFKFVIAIMFYKLNWQELFCYYYLLCRFNNSIVIVQ